MKTEFAINKTVMKYFKHFLEIILLEVLLSYIYIYIGLNNSPLLRQETLETAKINIEYCVVSLMLCVGMSLFMDYVLKKEKTSD